jgi:hypothetical protein
VPTDTPEPTDTPVPTNSPPRFEIEPPPEEVAVEAGQNLSYALRIVDPDPNETLTVSLDPFTTPSWLSLEVIGPNQVELKGTPGEDAVGSYNVTVTARDSAGAEVQLVIPIEVIAGSVSGATDAVNAAGTPADDPTGDSQAITTTGVLSGTNNGLQDGGE